MKKDVLSEIFDYEQDKPLLIELLHSVKHVAFAKSIIKFLAENDDKNVPDLIIEFCKKKYSEGSRASLLLLLDKYDCTNHLQQVFSLFLNDTYNTTWYCYDILKKYLKVMSDFDLDEYYSRIKIHLLAEVDVEKSKFHELLLRNINTEREKRIRQ